MTSTVRETTTIDADPDAVWAVVGDVGAVSDWVPALESSSVEGDLRTAEFAGGGGTAHERITLHDAARRTYSYSYVDGPLALKQYDSTILVEAADGGSRVVWSAEFAAGSPEEEQGLQTAIAGIYAGALTELASRFGGSGA